MQVECNKKAFLTLLSVSRVDEVLEGFVFFFLFFEFYFFN